MYKSIQVYYAKLQDVSSVKRPLHDDDEEDAGADNYDDMPLGQEAMSSNTVNT